MADDMEEDGYDGLEDLHSDSSSDDYFDIQQALVSHGTVNFKDCKCVYIYLSV